MSDTLKMTLGWIMLLAVLILATTVAATYDSRQAKATMRAMIEAGAEPTAASCAVYRSAIVCIAAAGAGR